MAARRSDRAGRARGWFPAVAAVVVRPSLWPTALRQALRLARPGWWRRAPFLPVPDRAYVAFRLETHAGDDTAVTGAELVRYLRWCRAEERAIATGRSDRHR